MPRLVQVAVDAAAIPGGQTYTYHLPPGLADIAPGEAVLVEYGRRETVGVVLGHVAGPVERETKPVLARIHAGGPILPELQARLADRLARHYLAPPHMVVRQMLPPGMLERVELRAIGWAGRSPVEAAGEMTAIVVAVVAAGPEGLAPDEMPWTGTRAALTRRLRQAQADGLIRLERHLVPPGARPRLERIAGITAEGRSAAELLAAGRTVSGRALGPRQRALLAELAADGADGRVAAAELASRHGPGSVSSLARRGLIELEVAVRPRRPVEGRGAAARGATERGTLPHGASLSDEQRAIVARVEGLVRAGQYAGLLMEGATASGKTAVYAASIAAALDVGRGAVMLVPEIALAAPLLDRLRHDLGVDVAILHSSLGEGERADEWRRIRAGEARVVVGTRIAVLAPLADPGIIVVDEEHDAAYKSDRTPRYQARDTALELGRLAGIPVLLGSATPEVVSIGRARMGELEHHRLTERAAGAPVAVEVVDLRQELQEGNRGMLSKSLADALAGLDREAGDRAILVINRRGSASVILCRDCGYVQVCPECHRPLVFHAAAMALRCHHCGAGAPVARRCPACGSARIRYLGGGTERVEHEVHVRLPHLRVGRLDRDVVERKGAAARVVDDLAEGRVDVLVGTSLVTKGLDVPEVVLVGVVSADIALNLPDERAAERTYQLLTQAIGRAGRGDRPGRAIIQTYQPEHRAIRAVVEGDPGPFIEAELEARRAFGSPPFGRIIKLTVAMEDRDAAEAEARRMASELRDRATALAGESDAEGRLPASVMGPAPAYVVRRAGRWRFHVVLRGRDPRSVLGGDPGAPWSVDVDPESLL